MNNYSRVGERIWKEVFGAPSLQADSRKYANEARIGSEVLKHMIISTVEKILKEELGQ